MKPSCIQIRDAPAPGGPYGRAFALLRHGYGVDDVRVKVGLDYRRIALGIRFWAPELETHARICDRRRVKDPVLQLALDLRRL